MRINNVDNNSNKTTFGWIIPLNNAEKKCGLKAWQFANDMNGIGQYDVYIKPLKSKTTRERDLGCLGPLIYPLIIFASAMAGLGGGSYLFANFLPNLTGGFLQIGASLLGALGLVGGIMNAVMFKRYNDFSVQAATQRGEKDENGNPTPAGIITEEHIIKNDSNRYHPNVHFVNEIQLLMGKRFNDFIKHYDTNDLFEPKNYLRVLQNRPKELNGAEFFNYRIDDKGNTLTTAFFDVVPNDKEYPKIIEYLKRQKNLDFNKKDGNGISCIEKVLISENKDALNLILNSKYTMEYKRPFGWIIDTPYEEVERMEKEPRHDPSVIPYSPEIDDLYLNIQDESFKKMVDDNIKWDFSNWIAVIQSHDVSKAEKLKERFNSPLLNKQQLYIDINKALSTCKDMNFITYMQTNFLPELQKTIKEK